MKTYNKAGKPVETLLPQVSIKLAELDSSNWADCLELCHTAHQSSLPYAHNMMLMHLRDSQHKTAVQSSRQRQDHHYKPPPVAVVVSSSINTITALDQEQYKIDD